jgi:hypothetical protein
MDFKSWIRDIFSPSNLLAAFQFFFPQSAAAVAGILMGWLTSVRTLPISVPILVGLVTWACVIIIIDYFRTWFDRHNKYVKRIAELEEALEPKLSIVSTSYVHPGGLQQGVRTVRLEIRNTSNAVLKNCRVREARFVNNFGQESQMRRHFRLNEEAYADDGSHTYRQTFDLNGMGATEIIDVAQLDETNDDSRVLMLYATSPTVHQPNSIVRACFPHRLTVSVTAENMLIAFERTYDLSIANGRLQMDEVRQ